MAIQILKLQWKTIRLALIPLVIAAFSLPLASVQVLDGGFASLAAHELLSASFPMLAGAVGVLLGLSIWNWDHQGGHVYALSLPVARWEYALLKFGAGVVLVLVPGVAFLAGSLVATAAVEIPAGLDAYPVELTLRFLFGSLLVYALLFALASGTTRTAVTVLAFVAAGPVLAEMAIQIAAVFWPEMAQIRPVEWVWLRIVEFPGPFGVFTDSWMLIDV